MKPDTLLSSLILAFKELFCPIIIAVISIGCIFVLIAKITNTTSTKGFPAFLLSFGFLGGVSGLIAGASREPIVGGLLTGLLGIISGLLSYLFGKKSLKQWHHYIPYAIMMLVICSLAGLSIGGTYKAKWEKFDRENKVYLLEYEKVYLEVLKEERLMKLKKEAETNKRLNAEPLVRTITL